MGVCSFCTNWALCVHTLFLWCLLIAVEVFSYQAGWAGLCCQWCQWNEHGWCNCELFVYFDWNSLFRKAVLWCTCMVGGWLSGWLSVFLYVWCRHHLHMHIPTHVRQCMQQVYVHKSACFNTLSSSWNFCVSILTTFQEKQNTFFFKRLFRY